MEPNIIPRIGHKYKLYYERITSTKRVHTFPYGESLTATEVPDSIEVKVSVLFEAPEIIIAKLDRIDPETLSCYYRS